MNIGNENFDQLRKLLKLKRYEQPPPGYFSRFSDLVVARIEKGGVEQLEVAPWLAKFLRLLDANPFLAGALGVLVCGGLIGGIVLSQQGDNSSMAAVSPAPFNGNYAFNPTDNKPDNSNADSLRPAGLGSFSTNANGSAFGDFGASLQPVNFAPAN